MTTPKKLKSLPEEFKRTVEEGRCGRKPSARGVLCAFAPSAIIDEATKAAGECVDMIRHLKRDAEELVGNDRNRYRVCDDERWWLQFHLVCLLNSGLALGEALSSGAADRFILAYPSGAVFTLAGVSCNNVHSLVCHVGLNMVAESWSVIRASHGAVRKPFNASMLSTYRRPLVSMRESQDGAEPVFEKKHVTPIAKLIYHYPHSEISALAPRLAWENLRAKETCDVNAAHAITDAPVSADVQKGVIRVEGTDHEAPAHHCQMVKALVDAQGFYVTGPKIQDLPGCRGKKISREIKNLLQKVPGLKKYVRSEGPKGYRMVF